MVAELFLAGGQLGGQADRHDEAFRNSANAPNKINVLLLRHHKLVRTEKERERRENTGKKTTKRRNKKKAQKREMRGISKKYE